MKKACVIGLLIFLGFYCLNSGALDQEALKMLRKRREAHSPDNGDDEDEPEEVFFDPRMITFNLAHVENALSDLNTTLEKARKADREKVAKKADDLVAELRKAAPEGVKESDAFWGYLRDNAIYGDTIFVLPELQEIKKILAIDNGQIMQAIYDAWQQWQLEPDKKRELSFPKYTEKEQRTFADIMPLLHQYLVVVRLAASLDKGSSVRAEIISTILKVRSLTALLGGSFQSMSSKEKGKFINNFDTNAKLLNNQLKQEQQKKELERLIKPFKFVLGKQQIAGYIDQLRRELVKPPLSEKKAPEQVSKQKKQGGDRTIPAGNILEILKEFMEKK